LARHVPAANPVRLGIIGTGMAAKRLHWPALASMQSRFTIVAFADHTRSAAEEFAALAGLSMDDYYPDHRALLQREDVEAVLVAVPIASLCAITLDCLTAGKHVICEKPPGADLDEARRLVAAAEEHPRQVTVVAENFFYRDDLRLARSLLDRGVIGEPQLLLERWVRQLTPTVNPFAAASWRRKPEHHGGSLLDGGVHSVAAIRLLGGDISNLCARTKSVNPAMKGPTLLLMSFDLASGAMGNCVWGFFANPVPGEVNDTRLYGAEGALTVSRGRVVLSRDDGSIEEYRLEQGDGGYYNEFLNFYEAIVHHEPVVGTVRQSIENMAVVLRALGSVGLDWPSDGSTMDLGPLKGGVPLWRPREAEGLFDTLPTRVHVA